MHATLLIIEDDQSLNAILQMHFEDLGFTVFSANNLQGGREVLSQQPIDLLLLDQQLPDGHGIDLLKELSQQDNPDDIVMMTGQHDLELAIEAIKLGAADFIHKPVKTAELEHVINKTLTTRRLSRQVQTLKSKQTDIPSNSDMIGKSDAMLAVSKQIALSAASNTTVLILGETGTGKEVVARMIHNYSEHEGAFIAVNCAAIVDTLLESELFGHEKGAFTGADSSKTGKFEQANNGTIFLDEIGELALPLQAKLLRALQEKSIEKVGGQGSIPISARIIAATHRNLEQEVQQHSFREDLFYRLQVITIHIPPVRDRKEDIPLLVNGLLKKIANQIDKPTPSVSEQSMAMLTQYDWPGNVREMENVLTQAMIQSRSDVLTHDILSIAPSTRTESPINEAVTHDHDETLPSLDQVEAAHIQKVLDHCQGHKGKSCKILGISRPALDRKIGKYNLLVAK